MLRAARWKAARAGLSGELVDPVTGLLVPAVEAVRGLVDLLADDLDPRGELAEVRELTAQLLARGTSAVRQRQVFARTGDPGAVVRDLLQVGGTAV